jgi:hypothetical protein
VDQAIIGDDVTVPFSKMVWTVCLVHEPTMNGESRLLSLRPKGMAVDESFPNWSPRRFKVVRSSDARTVKE